MGRRELHKTPPSLSVTIRKLEEDLGVPLVELILALQWDAVDVGIPLFQEEGDGYGVELIWHDAVAVLARVQKSY